jgi:hypothetical protein
LAFGTGAGLYAGAHTYATTEGDVSEKAAAARDSGLTYAIGGTVGMTGALKFSTNYRKGIASTYAGGKRSYVTKTLDEVLAGGAAPTRGVYEAKAAGAGLSAVAGRPEITGAGRFVKGIPGRIGTYAKGIGTEFSAARATGGIGAGISRVAERKGLMTGLGAAVGAAIGAHADREHPGRGAAAGGVIGGGAGLAVSTGLRASRLWKNIGPIGRGGLVAGLSTLAFAGAAYAGRPRYGSMDMAQREDNGLRNRMNSMSATGDVVLGLHNGR